MTSCPSPGSNFNFVCRYNDTLPPYWTKIITESHLQPDVSGLDHWNAFTPVTSLLLHVHQQQHAIVELCRSYDVALQLRLKLQVSQEYALLTALAHRQVTGAMSLAWLKEFEQPLAFVKEVKSAARLMCNV